MDPKKQETTRQYKREEMAARGRKGGRPRALTLEERQQQLLKAQENKKGVEDTPGKLPGSLKELKKLYLHQRRPTGDPKYKPGEG